MGTISSIITLKVYRYVWLDIPCVKILSDVSSRKYWIFGFELSQKNEFTICLISKFQRLKTVFTIYKLSTNIFDK